MSPHVHLRRALAAMLCLLAVGTAAAEDTSDAALLEKKNFVRNNCFEVVVLKNEKDSLTYEKPLDFDLIKYSERMDKYIPLGTAFPIDAEHFVTAAHVLTLTDKSMVYPQRFIRIKETVNGKSVESVYEIDQITAYNNHRDYAVFTAKGLKVKNWFQTESNITFNEKVYTAGDAYGEGIIVREGVLVGDFPEEEKSEWNYLKSSVATNPGNSGGPLLNKDFKVIGIVLQKKDDFCYSLPLKEIIPNKMIFHRQTFFRLSGLNARIKKACDFDMPLPAPYRNVVDYCDSQYNQIYVSSMNQLISENADKYFPNGEKSLQALYSANLSIFPQAYLQDTNDDNWFLSKLDSYKSDIGGNGNVQWNETFKDSGIWFLKIKSPEGVKPADYIDNPTLLMDTILKGVSIKRQLNSNDSGTRIVSNGKPIESFDYLDSFGRNWKTNVWLMDFIDKAVITFTLPTPNGACVIYRSVDSSDKNLWMYDLKKQCDLTAISFTGTLPEWTAFLSGPVSRYDGLKNLKIAYEPGKKITFANEEFSVTADPDMFAVGDKNEIVVNTSVYLNDGKPVWGIRRVLFDEGGENGTFMLFFKWVKPDARLDKDYQDDWNQNVVKKIHPYTKTPYSADGRTSIASMHPSFYDAKTGNPKGNTSYSLFISRPGAVDDATMKAAISHFESALTFK